MIYFKIYTFKAIFKIKNMLSLPYIVVIAEHKYEFWKLSSEKQKDSIQERKTGIHHCD